MDWNIIWWKHISIVFGFNIYSAEYTFNSLSHFFRARSYIRELNCYLNNFLLWSTVMLLNSYLLLSGNKMTSWHPQFGQPVFILFIFKILMCPLTVLADQLLTALQDTGVPQIALCSPWADSSVQKTPFPETANRVSIN